MEKQNRILVTGGAGFVGSNLCGTLLRHGASVDCVDNLITGRLAAIEPLHAEPRFRFFERDVTDPAFVDAFAAGRYDEIYHLACPTGVPNIRLMGEEMLKTCSVGTDNVMRLAQIHDARVLYTSSAEVYGDPKVFPQTEDYCGDVNPTGPRSAYEEAKRFGESLLTLYVEKYNVDARIVRIFNTFGIGMSPDDTRLIPSFLRSIKRGDNLVIYGDGQQTRTHLYIDDLVSGLMLVMDKGRTGEVYNVGGNVEVTINQLAEMVRQLTPVPTAIEHRPHFTEDHLGRRPAVEKVTELGWWPKTSVSEGLRTMMKSHGIPVQDGDLGSLDELGTPWREKAPGPGVGPSLA